MIIEKTHLSGVVVLKPKVWRDQRGYFFESYRTDLFNNVHINSVFVQDNESLSSTTGVLRGLHFQIPPSAQAKLVRVIKGSVLDVAVDIRRNSNTYGQYYKHILSEENKEMLFIPEGFAHGFLTLEPNTIFSYKCSDYYNPVMERGIMWNDPTLNIKWDIDQPTLSEKDQKNIMFKDFESPFHI